MESTWLPVHRRKNVSVFDTKTDELAWSMFDQGVGR
jgi:hypothetical protein